MRKIENKVDEVAAEDIFDKISESDQWELLKNDPIIKFVWRYSQSRTQAKIDYRKLKKRDKIFNKSRE